MDDIIREGTELEIGEGVFSVKAVEGIRDALAGDLVVRSMKS
jgi:hypothetical protein